MFKYPKKPEVPSPAAPSPFAPNDIPEEWASPVAPAAETPVADPSYYTEDTTSPFDAPVPSAAPVASRNVLNYDVSVVGILRFTDDLLVDGSVEGEITSDGVLTVGANASIQASDKNKVAVRTKSAIIHGKVIGDIEVTDRVVLASTAELVGDVTAARISIEEGAVFVGHCSVGSPASAPVPTASRKSGASKKNVSPASDANLLG
ncbi:MAG: polymer-forming cytoskeletal protein [Akkermansia sp.]|nr:polymer-forming cytoskeletal protein [Akkermansia sp.]